VTLPAVRRRWSTYRLTCVRQDRDHAIMYVRGQLRALEDMIADINIIIPPPKKRRTSDYEILARLINSRDEARKLLDMLIFDKERDEKDGEVG
jgi:hypothetical protein